MKNPHLVSRLVYVEDIPKSSCYRDTVFSFLNLTKQFTIWNDTAYGMLWAYNLNYMDWLCQSNMSFEVGAEWIDKFTVNISENRIGLNSYPIALRGINWIKFISKYYDRISVNRLSEWNDALYSQYSILNHNLEYHLCGNHLLEDAYSLFIASIYFNDISWYNKAIKLLYRELDEQILPDGAHYEQSPMYHCVLLEHLLDCCNFSINNILFQGQGDLNEVLIGKAKLMLGHLESIVYADATIPLLNDSAYGIASTPMQLFSYAKRLGISWSSVEMKECGYRKLSNVTFEAIVDVGNIMATYQPGHSHADTFGYELRISGQRFIIDTGISTYEKNDRRQLERSTKAHNTVTVYDCNSSEVWSGFRIGKRAHVSILAECSDMIIAEHNGFGKKCIHKRAFKLSAGLFEIEDNITLNDVLAKSYIHFAPGVRVISYGSKIIETNMAYITIDGACRVELRRGTAADEYNELFDIDIIVIYFSAEVRYRIKIQ